MKLPERVERVLGKIRALYPALATRSKGDGDGMELAKRADDALAKLRKLYGPCVAKGKGDEVFSYYSGLKRAKKSRERKAILKATEAAERQIIKLKPPKSL